MQKTTKDGLVTISAQVDSSNGDVFKKVYFFWCLLLSTNLIVLQCLDIIVVQHVTLNVKLEVRFDRGMDC